MFLKWENVQIKFVAKIKTHILCSKSPSSRKSCRLWKIWYVWWNQTGHRPRWINKATHTHSEFVIFTACLHSISGFRKRALMYNYTYIASLISKKFLHDTSSGITVFHSFSHDFKQILWTFFKAYKHGFFVHHCNFVMDKIVILIRHYLSYVFAKDKMTPDDSRITRINKSLSSINSCAEGWIKTT